jgi:predicted GNAT superfamily acetyltransferase
MGTDRFVVEWDISEEGMAKGEERGERGEGRKEKSVGRGQMINILGPVVNTEQDDDGSLIPVVHELSEVKTVRVEIPADIQVVKAASPQRAGEWRASTRHAFMFYLQRGYEVAGFFRDEESNRCFYLVGQKEK